MKLIKETPDSINNMKELIALLHGYDFDMKKAGNGNGVAKVVGQNLQITDTYFYGGKEALEKLVANWTSSSSGTYAKFFKEDYGITFTLVSKDIDQGGKDGGTVSIVVKPTFGKKESMNIKKEAIRLLDEAGRYDGPDYRDGFGNRMGGASDEGETDEPIDFRKATYSVYIDKRLVKGGLPGNRATAYAAAIRKNKPTANVWVKMDI